LKRRQSRRASKKLTLVDVNKFKKGTKKMTMKKTVINIPVIDDEDHKSDESKSINNQ